MMSELQKSKKKWNLNECTWLHQEMHRLFRILFFYESLVAIQK